MKMKLGSIEMDVSIQCRASIDTATVNEYAERMGEGDEFPAVVLFGTSSKAWIGDGWHRIMAARQMGAETILAELHPGGRADALKHALGANALHGHRRSNADKRRCVEIALREFPKLSSRAVSKLAGVSHTFVDACRPQVATVATSEPRTGADGKTYPAHVERPQAVRTEWPAVDCPSRAREDETTEAEEEPEMRSNAAKRTVTQVERGSHDNWEQFRGLAAQALDIHDQMKSLVVHQQSMFKARELCEKLAAKFSSLAQKQAR